MNRSLTVAAALLAAALPLAAQNPPPRAIPLDPGLQAMPAEDLFRRGKNLYDAAMASTDLDGRIELFNRASDIFRTYLNEFGNHRNAEMAWWYLGGSYYHGGNMDEGKRCFHILLTRYGKGKWAGAAAYTLAAEHYNKTEYLLAAPLFERSADNAAKADDRARSNFYAGNCHRMTGHDREAFTAYRKVLDDPAGVLFAPQSKVALGHLAVRAGKFAEALAFYEEVANSPAPMKIRGEAALHAALTAAKLDQPEVSDKYLRMVLTTPGMDEFRVDAQTALMANQFAKEDYEGVIRTYRATQLKATGEKEAARLMIVARSYMRVNKPADALAMFREVERLVRPENDLAFQASYYRLLCFFRIEGRHVPEQVDAFLGLYRKSHADDTRIHTALMMKAETLFANKDLAGAAKVYAGINASRVSEKNRPGLYYQRGWCLVEAGDPGGGIRSLTEFIDRYPQDERVPSAIAKRAQGYVAAAESAKAIKDFDLLTAEGMPADLTSYAWLESARLRRTEGNPTDMVVRYQALLANVKGLNPKIQAEANYWIGQGLTKTNAAKEAVPYLEEARKLRPETYAKHAGLLLILGYFAQMDLPRISAEIDLAIKGGYDPDIPEQILRWTGLQAFNAGDFAASARFLNLIATPKEPRETPKDVWRYLAKSALETGDATAALEAADNTLAVEDNPGWKADGLLDRGRALFALGRYDEARVATDDGLLLRPQGRTNAGLRTLSGDLFRQAGDLAKAIAEYLIAVEFIDDKELKPRTLHSLIEAYDKSGDPASAREYREQLRAKFPDWKPAKPKPAPAPVPAPTPAPAPVPAPAPDSGPR